MNGKVGFADKRGNSAVGRWLRKVSYKVISTPFGSWLARKSAPVDRHLLMRSRGRVSFLGAIGAPSLLLATTGSKSGLQRTTALLYARDGDRLIVAGSNFGGERHPAWSSNLLKTPNAVVTMRGRSVPALSQLLEGKEAESAYSLMTSLAPMYQNYRAKTDRDIRVFALKAV